MFFDYVDPASGILIHSSNVNKIYNEICGIQQFLTGDTFGFRVQ